MSYMTTTRTPVGPFTIVADDDDAVLAAGWTADADAVLARISETLRPDDVVQRADGSPAAVAVVAYCDGDLSAPAGVAVRQRSGPFVTAAWTALRGLRPGEVVSYTQLADLSGRPSAVRAAAGACAANPSALFVPCHRVVRRDRGLGGFAWGLDVKRWLLAHERAGA